MATDWTGRPFPAFALESLEGERWEERALRGRRTAILCFASR